MITLSVFLYILIVREVWNLETYIGLANGCLTDFSIPDVGIRCTFVAYFCLLVLMEEIVIWMQIKGINYIMYHNDRLVNLDVKLEGFFKLCIIMT